MTHKYLEARDQDGNLILVLESAKMIFDILSEKEGVEKAIAMVTAYQSDSGASAKSIVSWDLSEEPVRERLAQEAQDGWKEQPGYEMVQEALDLTTSGETAILDHYKLTSGSVSLETEGLSIKSVQVTGLRKEPPTAWGDVQSVVRVPREDEFVWSCEFRPSPTAKAVKDSVEKMLTGETLLEDARSAFVTWVDETYGLDASKIAFSLGEGFTFGAVKAKAESKSGTSGNFHVTAVINGVTYQTSGTQGGALGRLADQAGIKVSDADRDARGNKLYNLRKGRDSFTMTGKEAGLDWLTSLTVKVG